MHRFSANPIRLSMVFFTDFSSVQFSSVTQSCLTLCNPMNCSTQGLPVHHQLLEFTQTHVHWVGDAIQPSHPLLSPFPPAPQSLLAAGSFPMSRVFSLHMRWPKYWSFSFSISPSNEHPGLISFRMDWLDLLEVPGTLKSLLQHHSSKVSTFWHSAFFTELEQKNVQFLWKYQRPWIDKAVLRMKTELEELGSLTSDYTESESHSVLPTLCDLMDYIVHGILQDRILEWVASPFSRGSCQCRDLTQVSCIAGRFFTSWTTREAQEYWSR